MIFEDKLIMLRLASEPEFAARLQELVQTCKLGDKPVLIAQVRPAGEHKVCVPLREKAVVDTFREGERPQDNHWGGFHSLMNPQETFHGLAGQPSRIEPTWRTELHRDGHMLAALWDFAELPNSAGERVRVAADFHAGFFVQFFAHALAVLRASGGQGVYRATATLLGASKLHYAARGRSNHYSVVGDPTPIDNLQWSVWSVDLGGEDWNGLGRRFAESLAGAYGQLLSDQ